MADGRDDNFNIPPNRGNWLRYHGSTPRGSQKQSFKPEYSKEADYTEGGMTPISGRYARTLASDENYSENFADSSNECCNEKGLILKQPL